MSNQSKAKTEQGYVEKPIPHKCSTCCYYMYDVETREGWGRVMYDVKKKLRCLIGGFAVKPNAICDRFDSCE